MEISPPTHFEVLWFSYLLNISCGLITYILYSRTGAQSDLPWVVTPQGTFDCVFGQRVLL